LYLYIEIYSRSSFRVPTGCSGRAFYYGPWAVAINKNLTEPLAATLSWVKRQRCSLWVTFFSRHCDGQRTDGVLPSSESAGSSIRAKPVAILLLPCAFRFWYVHGLCVEQDCHVLTSFVLMELPAESHKSGMHWFCSLAVAMTAKD